MSRAGTPSLIQDFLKLFFPQLCAGCGNDLFNREAIICPNCLQDLPHTGFASFENNPVERIFTGRLNINKAHSEFYFHKSGIIQGLIHQLKYKGNKEVGYFLGKQLGKSLLNNEKFQHIDLIIPMPLYKTRERKRGYNQAHILSEGISSITGVPVTAGLVKRVKTTDSQTKKDRTERWENVRNSFIIEDPRLIYGKHVLLTDDVITTGATLEACGEAIAAAMPAGISIATLAIAAK